MKRFRPDKHIVFSLFFRVHIGVAVVRCWLQSVDELSFYTAGDRTGIQTTPPLSNITRARH